MKWNPARTQPHRFLMSQCQCDLGAMREWKVDFRFSLLSTDSSINTRPPSEESDASEVGVSTPFSYETWLWIGGSQSGVPRLAASSFSRDLWERQIPGTQSTYWISTSWRTEPQALCLNKSSKWFWTPGPKLKFEKHCPGWPAATPFSPYLWEEETLSWKVEGEATFLSAFTV